MTDQMTANELAALFTPLPYDPLSALKKAQALLPHHLQRDPYWLPLILICANAALEPILNRINFTTERLTNGVEDSLCYLSHGQYFLATLALHLFNDSFKLPNDGLTNLQILDDWHFELAMHAIRIHSRGLKQ